VAQSRVVTLIGVGGVGKTRLAVQTAAEVLPRYCDGVWLCELGPLSDPGQVPNVVANALGVRQRPGSPATSLHFNKTGDNLRSGSTPRDRRPGLRPFVRRPILDC
jgi:predicted ATPase